MWLTPFAYDARKNLYDTQIKRFSSVLWALKPLFKGNYWEESAWVQPLAWFASLCPLRGRYREGSFKNFSISSLWIYKAITTPQNSVLYSGAVLLFRSHISFKAFNRYLRAFLHSFGHVGEAIGGSHIWAISIMLELHWSHFNSQNCF